MEGAWRQDAVAKVKGFFQEATAERLGHIDLTRNLHRHRARELSVRYQTPPTSLHEDEAASTEMQPLVASMWPVAARNERYTVSMNTCFIRHDWAAPGTPDEGLMHTVVTPDLAYVECDPERPSVPVYAIHARQRKDPADGNKVKWFWDEFDVREQSPTFRVLRPRDGSTDISRATDYTDRFITGDLNGANYHWTANGRPYVGLIPYQSDPGHAGVYDWREGAEIVEATLIEAALWSMWAYGVRDGSHPPRALADGEVITPGESAGSGRSARVDVAADPTTLLMVRSIDNGAAHALQWQPGVDPERLQLAIAQYAQGALAAAGLSPDDFVASGAAESGYAISLKSEAKRREQKRMGPAFERADSLSLAMSASLLNRYTSASLPEDGWAPQYAELSLTPAEKQERREDVAARLAAGTASLVDAVMAENPQMNRDQAAAHLEIVRQERSRFRPDSQPV